MADILAELRGAADPVCVQGMTRYGINPRNTLGVKIPLLRRIARRTGPDHRLARALWKTGVHEARILAAMLADPAALGRREMNAWAADFDSWDVVDQVCLNLFVRSPLASDRAVRWASDGREFVKRAGFSLMACLAVHAPSTEGPPFDRFLSLVKQEACDGRNYVKKSVNWALRQIGKRDGHLHQRALAIATRLARSPDSSERWVGRDAVRELSSVRVRTRIRETNR